jgi:hypothetical protein
MEWNGMDWNRQWNGIAGVGQSRSSLFLKERARELPTGIDMMRRTILYNRNPTPWSAHRSASSGIHPAGSRTTCTGMPGATSSKEAVLVLTRHRCHPSLRSLGGAENQSYSTRYSTGAVPSSPLASSFGSVLLDTDVATVPVTDDIRDDDTITPSIPSHSIHHNKNSIA